MKFLLLVQAYIALSLAEAPLGGTLVLNENTHAVQVSTNQLKTREDHQKRSDEGSLFINETTHALQVAPESHLKPRAGRVERSTESSLFLNESSHAVQVLPEHQLEARASQHKRANKHVTVTGIKGTGVHPRLEIRVMQQEYPYMFNLFLLALQKMKHRVQTEQLSYYQITGIHGVPNIPYAGVKANPKATNYVGYCTHNSPLFPVWHRPYVALFEQAFHKCAEEVAHQFKGAKRTKYVKIAKTMRFPYWDWAIAPPKGQNTLPVSIIAKTVNLDTPSGRKTIPNPLFDYNFHPFNGDQFIEGPWNAWRHTLRRPSSTAPNAHTRVGNLLRAVNQARPNLKALVYSLFTQHQSWPQFSNAGTNGYNSLEAIHNALHGTVGGGGGNQASGHMTVPWYSAFDPIFWLHHTNVDRILAMWQRTHPKEWVTAQRAAQSTFTIATGSIQGAKSPLTPFRHAKGGFWTSNSARGWEQFGYTYPDFSTTGGSAKAIRRLINAKYGPHSTAHAAKRDLNISPGDLIPAITTSNGSYYEYTAHIIAPHNALNGSYSIYIFLGDPPSDLGEWDTASNMIGTNFIFAAPNAASMGTQLVTGSVSLTEALTKKVSFGALNNLAVDMIVPFLQGSLNWRIAQNGVEIPPENVPGFKVSVISQELTLGADEYEFPTWSPETLLVNVTHGKPGGLNLGEVMHDATAFAGQIIDGLGEIGQDIEDGIGSIFGN